MRVCQIYVPKKKFRKRIRKLSRFFTLLVVALLPPPSVDVTRDHPSKGPAVDLRTNP